eukprot:7408242-Alexandrium_andersonii.AAC.1
MVATRALATQLVTLKGGRLRGSDDSRLPTFLVLSEMALVAAGVAAARWQEVPQCLNHLQDLVNRGTR